MEARAGYLVRRIGRLGAIGALVVVPLVSACGRDSNAGPERNVTIGDVQQKQYFYQGEYLGRTVTVSAPVSEIRGPRSFELSNPDSSADTLLVVTTQPVDLAQGQLVRVTGTVGQFHISPPSEEAPYRQMDLYSKAETKAYLYDATVEAH